MLTSTVALLLLSFTSPEQEKKQPPEAWEIAKLVQFFTSAEEPTQITAKAKLREYSNDFRDLTAKILAENLYHNDMEMRKNLIFLLQEMPSPKAIPGVSDRLDREDNLTLRRKLIETLGKIGGKEIIPPLQKQLHWAHEIPIMRDCLLALGKSAHPLAIDIILNFAASCDDEYLRKIAGRALRDLTKQNLSVDNLEEWQTWWRQHREAAFKLAAANEKKQPSQAENLRN